LLTGLFVLPAFSQTGTDHTPAAADRDKKVDSQKASEAGAEPGQTGEVSPSTLEVAPGKPAVKASEVERKPISPWKRLPRNVVSDQRSIWASPFRSSRQDVKWWLTFGGATAALVPADKYLAREMPNTSQQTSIATWTSRLGAAYTLLPISGTFYFIGVGAHDERFRETGILGFEALADATIVETVLKSVTHRERPLEGNGNGSFWSNKGSLWNSSFPSGHAINSVALASVIAHEYHDKKWVPFLAYGLAGAVVMSRFAARKHFASDVVVGSAMGWFIGDFVYGKRHNENVAPHSTLYRLLSHVRVGGGSQLPADAN
jgi:membrane-associated phospholipid phosphatase